MNGNVVGRMIPGSNYSDVGPVPPDNAPPSHVESALEALRSEVNDAAALQGELTVRLSLVLQPTIPDGEASNTASPCVSPLHDTLMARVSNMRHLNRETRELIDRLTI